MMSLSVITQLVWVTPEENVLNGGILIIIKVLSGKFISQTIRGYTRGKIIFKVLSGKISF